MSTVPDINKARRIIFWCGLVPCLLLSPIWGMGISMVFLVFSNSWGEQLGGLIVFLMGLSGVSGTIAYALILRRIKRHEPHTRIEYILTLYALGGFIITSFFLGFSITMTAIDDGINTEVWLATIVWVVAVFSQYIALRTAWKARIKYSPNSNVL